MTGQVKYRIEFETIDGETHKHEWVGFPEEYYQAICRPHGPHGVSYQRDGYFVCVPWSQIVKSSWTFDVL